MFNRLSAKLKKITNNIYVQNISLILLIISSFLFLDLGFRYCYNYKIGIGSFINTPILFSIFYCLLFLLIIYILPRNKGRIVYAIIYGIFIIIVFSQSIHYETLMRFWTFNDLFSVSEGSKYFLDLLKNVDKKVLLLLMGCSFILVFTFRSFKKTEKLKINSKVKFSVFFSFFLTLILIRCQALIYLEKTSSEEETDLNYALSSIYANYNNPNKSLISSGIYEYTFRTTFLYIDDKFNHNYQADYNYIDTYFESRNLTNTTNSHTGILKDKNVIFIMLESIDEWLVNEEVMPTLTKLSKTGINFTNRFAPTFGSGYTFNTEYALNTGYYSPINSGAFNYDKNNYDLSFANLLKQNGYTVNSIHKNNGSFYNRTIMHKSLGYENHYAIADLFDLDEYLLENDKTLVTNDSIYNLIINKKEKFMIFITTYSAHLPYNYTNVLCNKEDMDKSSLKVSDNLELSCVQMLANITDQFLKKLLIRLEEDNLLDNTALIIASDHYTYQYSDKEYLYKKKGTDNSNMLQKTPFIIWNKDLNPETNNTVLGTIDIMPTLLNMLDIDYDPTYYLGEDIYSNNHSNYVYFSDNSWYDGEKYHNVDEDLTPEEKEIASEISEKIKVNDKLVKSDYFGYKFK